MKQVACGSQLIEQLPWQMNSQVDPALHSIPHDSPVQVSVHSLPKKQVMFELVPEARSQAALVRSRSQPHRPM